MSANKQQCQASYAIQVPGPHGFLSSAVTAATGCGTSYHPWVIEVAPTQRVNVTLFDFSAGAAPAAGGRVVPPGTCREYAVVKEDGARNVAVSAAHGARGREEEGGGGVNAPWIFTSTSPYKLM